MIYKHDPQIPWGYWLDLTMSAAGGQTVKDGDRTYDSLRNYFWQKRLNMCACDVPEQLDQQLDLMHLALERIYRFDDEMVPALVTWDLFHHDQFWAHYMYFLNSVGLSLHGAHPLHTQQLSPEGKAVRLMLRMTSRLAASEVPRLVRLNREAAGATPMRDVRS